MPSDLRSRIDSAPRGAWFRPSDLGGGNTAEQMLSRLSRDPSAPIVRAAQGLYFKSGPADRFFGKRRPAPLATAVEYADGRGVGPAGADAAAYLGLTSQVPPRWRVAVVGSKPADIDGVEWLVRKNPARTRLNPTEVAVVEVLSMFPYGVEAPWGEVVDRVHQLEQKRQVRLPRLREVVGLERRKPQLRENFDRLTAELAG